MITIDDKMNEIRIYDLRNNKVQAVILVDETYTIDMLNEINNLHTLMPFNEIRLAPKRLLNACLFKDLRVESSLRFAFGDYDYSIKSTHGTLDEMLDACYIGCYNVEKGQFLGIVYRYDDIDEIISQLDKFFTLILGYSK